MVRERGAGTKQSSVGGAARVALGAGLGAVLVAGAVLLGCAQALDLSSLREGSSDAGTISDATPAVEAATDAQVDAGPCPRIPGLQACNTILQCGCPIDENCEVFSLNGATSCTSVGSVPLWGNCKGLGPTGFKGAVLGECPKKAEPEWDGVC